MKTPGKMGTAREKNQRYCPPLPRRGKVSSQASPVSKYRPVFSTTRATCSGWWIRRQPRSLSLGQGKAGVFKPPLVVPEDPPLLVRHPGKLGNVVGHDPESFFALPQGLLGLLAIGDIALTTSPSSTSFTRCSRRRPALNHAPGRHPASRLLTATQKPFS